MMKRLLFWMAALLVAIGGVQQAKAYGTNDLTDAGWQPVTSLSSVSDYFYVIVDNSQDYFVSLSGTQIHYKAATDPLADFSVVWALETNGTSFGIRNIGNYKLLVQTENNAGWNLDLNDQPNVCGWTNFKFAYADDHWTIENGQYPYESEEASDAAPYRGYWGPWEGRENFTNLRIAGNKNLANRGYFQIYQISRADFVNAWLTANQARPADISFLYTGLTNSKNAWTNNYTGFTGNYQAQNATNKDIEGYTNRGYLESWNAGNVFSGTLTTTLNNLPDGIYDMGAYCFKDATNEVYFTSGDASTQLNNDNALYQYAENHVTVDYEGAEANKKTIGLNITSGTWIGITDIRLKYYGPVKISDVAIALTEVEEGANLVANQWYYFTVANDGNNVISTTTLGDIVYTADSTQLIKNITNTNTFDDIIVHLAAGTYYLRSSSAQNVTFTASTIPDKPEGLMSATVKSELDAAYAAYLADPSETNAATANEKIAAANASIAVYAQIGTLFTESQLGSINDYQSASAYTNYTTGQYSTLDEAVTAYKAFVANYWTNHTPAANDNLTALIVNNSFEMGDLTGWTLPGGNSQDTRIRENSNATYTVSNADGNYLFNTWHVGVPINQVINGLPNGTYRLTGLLTNGDADSKIYLTANDNHTAITSLGDKTTFIEGSVDFVVSNGTATIGAVGCTNDKESFPTGTNYWYWYKADNFRLTYLSADATVKPTVPTGKMYAEIQTTLTTAEGAFGTTPSIDNYNALVEAIAAANTSIKEYEKIARYLAAQKATTSSLSLDYSEFDSNYNSGVYTDAADFLAAFTPAYHAQVVAALGETKTANTDMTPYIVNASFEFGDATNWAHYSNGDSQVLENNGTYTMSNIDGDYLFNTWNNNADVKYIFQNLTNLPTGTYEVKAVFGSDANKSINLTGWSGGKEQATTFTTGADKSVGVEKTVKVVVDNGNLRLGANSTDWFKVDHFRLTFLTSEADMDYALVDAPMNAAVRTAQTDAETAYLANKSIENYNALVAAIDAAQASADIYVTINKRIGLLDAQRGAVVISALTTKYTNGEYVNADEVYTAYHDIVKTALANPTADTDMTPFIINPGFEFADNTGWNGGGAVAGLDGQKNIESFNSDNFNIHQVLTDLPNGTYTLTVQGFYRPGGNNNSSDAQNAELYGNDKSVAVKLVASEGKAAADDNGFTTENTNSGSSVYVPNWQNDGSLVFANAENYVNTLTIIVSDGTATIGVRKNNHIADDWALFDNFTLTFTSADLPSDFTDEIDALIADIDLTKKMNGETRAEYEAAINAWNAAGGKTAENYGKVIAAAPKAQASIVAYERALTAINETLILLNETNVYTSDGYSALFRTYNNYMSSYNNELLDDNAAVSIHGAIFGSGAYQQTNVAAVPFLGSAWDDQGDYTWRGIREKNQIFEENFWNYWVNTWSTEGANDGSNFTIPFMEYITDDNKTLTDRELTATVPAAPKDTYTVTGFIRARVAGGAEPTGIGLRLLNENDEIIGDATINWTRVGETEFWTARPTVSGDTPGEISATDGGELTTLKIQFYFEQTNSNWFAFKNMMYSPAHTVDAQDFVNLMDEMNAAIAYAESHTLGFDYKDDTHGTSVDEYTPYRHAEQLADLELLKDYKVALDNLIVEYNNQEIDDATFVQRAPRYILTNSLITKVAEAQWTPNTNEENAIFWRDNYTADDVVVLLYYNDDGTPSDARFNTILPTGWDLDGRTDAYNTRIQKNGVNVNAPGTWAVKGQTALFVKWNTNYGKQTGYTLPLKPGVKYAFQFNYCAWGNEGEFFDDDTEIRIVNKRTGHTVTVTDYGTSQGGGNETPNENWILLEGRPQQGNLYEQNWYMFRGDFITEAAADDEYTDDYEIYFDKQVKDRQQQIGLGDITLVRAPEEGSEYVLDGNSKDATKDFTPEFDYQAVAQAKFSRTFQATRDAENTGTWSTLVLPYKMDQKEVEDMLGEGVKLAYYSGCDLEGTQYMLHFTQHQAGILPNVPVMVFFEETKELTNYTLHNVVVTKDVPTVFDPQGNLDFVGTYTIAQTVAGDIYIGSDNKWKRSTGKTKLQPSRAYFQNVSGDPDLGIKLMGFSIDEVPTGIVAIDDEEGTMRVTSGNIYTIDGRLVRQNATSLEGLQPGIYVVDGKKYMIK